VDNVIRGVASLARDHGKRALLYVVGGSTEVADPRATPEIGRLMRVAQEEGIAKQVTFVGRRDREQLPLHYAACDVFVTTPWYEPFGITPVEAMACARPVIGASVGGIQSTVADGETGFLVPPHDPKALGERLAQLHGDRRLLRALGEAGLARAREHYTWKCVSRSLAECYRRAMDPRPRARRLPQTTTMRYGARG
jgi:glycosyltransferase involved in cell wall biosynthesis